MIENIYNHVFEFERLGGLVLESPMQSKLEAQREESLREKDRLLAERNAKMKK